MIYILTGKEHTGKTTNLFRWLKGKNGVFGILAPTLIGKKHLYSIRSNQTKQLEVEDGTPSSGKEELLKSNSHTYYASVFDWANKEINESLQQNPETIIVDGIGRLEFEEKGLTPMILNLIQLQQQNKFKNLILVLSENILIQAIEYFGLDNYKCKVGMPN